MIAKGVRAFLRFCVYVISRCIWGRSAFLVGYVILSLYLFASLHALSTNDTLVLLGEIETWKA